MMLILLAALANPVRNHLDRFHRNQMAMEQLVSQPYPMEFQKLNNRMEAFSGSARQLHSLLEEAELTLLVLRGRRERALILKDVGTKSGKLGREMLMDQFEAIRTTETRLLQLVGDIATAWEQFRQNPRENHLNTLIRYWDQAGPTIHSLTEQLEKYLEHLETIEGHSRTLMKLSPMAVSPVPDSFRKLLPGIAKVKQKEMDLRKLLSRFAALHPTALSASY